MKSAHVHVRLAVDVLLMGRCSSLRLSGKHALRRMAGTRRRAKGTSSPQTAQVAAGLAVDAAEVVVEVAAAIRHAKMGQAALVAVAVIKVIFVALIATRWAIINLSASLPRSKRRRISRRQRLLSRPCSLQCRRSRHQFCRSRSSSSMKKRCGRSCREGSMLKCQVIFGTSTMELATTTGDKVKFCELDEAVTGNVKFGDGSTVQIMGKGSILFSCKNGDQWMLQEVYYIPRLRRTW
jgi:hypothetical protein